MRLPQALRKRAAPCQANSVPQAWPQPPYGPEPATATLRPSLLQCSKCAQYVAGDASFYVLNNGTCVAFPMA